MFSLTTDWHRWKKPRIKKVHKLNSQIGKYRIKFRVIHTARGICNGDLIKSNANTTKPKHKTINWANFFVQQTGFVYQHSRENTRRFYNGCRRHYIDGHCISGFSTSNRWKFVIATKVSSVFELLRIWNIKKFQANFQNYLMRQWKWHANDFAMTQVCGLKVHGFSYLKKRLCTLLPYMATVWWPS